MAHVIAHIYSSSPTSTFMAAEALRRAALAAGHTFEYQAQQGDPRWQHTAPTQQMILVSDLPPQGQAPANGQHVSVADAIRQPGTLFTSAVATAPALADKPQRVVGITSCPTGIAHTFMAAEGLEAGAQALGYEVKIETQGSVGAGNTLSAEDIAAADVVIIAADTNVDLSRFTGKRVYQTGTKPAIKDGAAVVKTALVEATPYGTPATQADLMTQAAAAKAAKNEAAAAKGFGGQLYKHLMTGVSHMLPFVVAGGLLIALGFAFGGIYVYEDKYAGTIGNLLFNIGANGAFKLFIPVLAGYIAYSIADRPGLAPGMVGGLIAANTGSGFLGAMVAGFLAGYFVRWLNHALKLPRTLEGLKPTLLLPLIGTLVVGVLMYTVIGKPVASVLTSMTTWLQGLGQGSAGLLGALLGGMMAFDMGGPINKAAYTFSTGLIDSKVYGPIAAAMAAGMTPPMALFLATVLFKNRFTPDEREAGKAAGVLGLSFITEGAIPFAARDPLRVIPSLVIGSAVAGFISMATGCLLRAPHGGVFVLAIPGAVTNLPMYIVAIVVGTLVSTVLLGILKKPIVAAE